MRDEETDRIAEALENLSSKLDGAVASSKRRSREDNEPRSVSSLNRGRGEDPLEIQGVLFQVKVPVGRRGEVMPAYLVFPPVDDERELEELAADVEKRFRFATVYSPRGDRDRNGYGRDRYGYENRGYYRDRR